MDRPIEQGLDPESGPEPVAQRRKQLALMSADIHDPGAGWKPRTGAVEALALDVAVEQGHGGRPSSEGDGAACGNPKIRSGADDLNELHGDA